MATKSSPSEWEEAGGREGARLRSCAPVRGLVDGLFGLTQAKGHVGSDYFPVRAGRNRGTNPFGWQSQHHGGRAFAALQFAGAQLFLHIDVTIRHFLFPRWVEPANKPPRCPAWVGVEPDGAITTFGPKYLEA